MKLLAALPLLALASCATTEDVPAPTGASPAQIVAARQAAFNLTAATFGNLSGAVESGADVKPLTFAVRGLAKWSHALPGMFPPGTNLPESRALPSVWQDRPGFEAQAANFQAESARLLNAAGTGDKAAFAAAYKAVGATCASCHTAYRSDQPR
ncbi:MAG TPA: cytochrome c [Allosphingosinicella sp.]|jgi:cytochrome c556